MSILHGNFPHSFSNNHVIAHRPEVVSGCTLEGRALGTRLVLVTFFESIISCSALWDAADAKAV